LEVVEFLVDGCPENLLVPELGGGGLPMHLAATFQSANVRSDEVFRFLAHWCPDSLLVEDSSGCLPLYVAVANNNINDDDDDDSTAAHASTSQCLMNQCPDSRVVQDKDGSLPLHMAATTSASLEVIQCLFDKHPEALVVQGKGGRRPLHLAVANASLEAALVAENGGRLHIAVASLDVVQCLGDQHPEAFLVKESTGWLPLHIAAANDAPVKVGKCPEA
jgi:hypothetical protein